MSATTTMILLLKSHVKGHNRRTKSGGTVFVMDHDNKVQKKAGDYRKKANEHQQKADAAAGRSQTGHDDAQMAADDRLEAHHREQAKKYHALADQHEGDVPDHSEPKSDKPRDFGDGGQAAADAFRKKEAEQRKRMAEHSTNSPDYKRAGYHNERSNHHFGRMLEAQRAGNVEASDRHKKATRLHEDARRAFVEAGDHEFDNGAETAAPHRKRGEALAAQVAQHEEEHGIGSGAKPPEAPKAEKSAKGKAGGGKGGNGDGGDQMAAAKSDFEDKVYEAMTRIGGMTRSDAQAVAGAHDHLIDFGFDDGQSPEGVAQNILGASAK